MAAAWGGQGCPAGTSAQAAVVAASQERPVPRSARQLADEILPILRRQKTPWQLYGSYAQLFRDCAAREMAARPVAGRAAASQAKLAALLQGMADLLSRMGEQAKLRQSIQHGQSSVPPEQRQEAFARTGVELSRLVSDFARQASILPSSKTATPAGR